MSSKWITDNLTRWFFLKIQKITLLGLLLSFSIYSSATTYPFEGYWGTDKSCTKFDAPVEYHSKHARLSDWLKCYYSEEDNGKVEQIAANHWKIQTFCWLPLSKEEQQAEPWRPFMQPVGSGIELIIEDNRLTQSLFVHNKQGNKNPAVNLYYRCSEDGNIKPEENKTTLTAEQAKALFERAERLYFSALPEDCFCRSSAEKNEIYRLYQQAYEAGYLQATAGLGMAVLFGYNKIHEEAEPDWDKAQSLLQEGVALNDTRAMRGLATLYWDKVRSLEEGAEKAQSIVALYEQAHALGDPQATLLLGTILSGDYYSAYFATRDEMDRYNANFGASVSLGIAVKAKDTFDEITDIPRGLALLEQTAEAGQLDTFRILTEHYQNKEEGSSEETVERFIYYMREGAKRGHPGLLMQLSEIIKYVKVPAIILAENWTQEAKAQVNQCLDYISTQMKSREITVLTDFDKRCPAKLTTSPHDIEQASQIDWR